MIDFARLTLFVACNTLTLFMVYGVAHTLNSLLARRWTEFTFTAMFCTSALICAGATLAVVLR